MIGLSPVKRYQEDSNNAKNDNTILGYDPSGNKSYGLATKAIVNSSEYSHFNVNDYEVDMLLDFGQRSWSLCMVGLNDEICTKRFTNLN